MPLGIQRLNQRTHHPNDRIAFIKPLPGPASQTATDFLSRVAAICLPIMRHHHLSVTTLEEHEPNPEFAGRNFNGGEIIQLVLKAPGSGRWLPFRMVQMVMMHELAHCEQMNHSRAFWAVKNTYSDDLKGLWARGYTGDGMWGRGRALYDGQFAGENAPGVEDGMPRSLCGGTYRSRGRKRKRKRKWGGGAGQLSYAERKQRRIEKKFGKNGEALGEDEETRTLLERGKAISGKPRVAGSMRGRDLRAEAAILRFSQQKNTEEYETGREYPEESESTEYGDSEVEGDEQDGEAVDLDGTRMVDSKGHGMVKICGDEDMYDDGEARREMQELSAMLSITDGNARVSQHAQHDRGPGRGAKTIKEQEIDDSHLHRPPSAGKDHPGQAPTKVKKETSPSPCTRASHNDGPHTNHRPPDSNPPDDHSKLHPAPKPTPREVPHLPDDASATSEPNDAIPPTVPDPHRLPTLRLRAPTPQICTICSYANHPEALTCTACAHVLDTERLPRFWRCASEACRGGVYVNAGDAGRCGVCGGPKP